MRRIAAKQHAADRVADRRREQQQTERDGEVVAGPVQQPPAGRRAERIRQTGESRRRHEIQSAEPQQRPLTAERRKAERRAHGCPDGQDAERGKQRRENRICAAEQAGEDEPSAMHRRPGEPRRREQGHAVHQGVRAEQHIEIYDHRPSLP